MVHVAEPRDGLEFRHVDHAVGDDRTVDVDADEYGLVETDARRPRIDDFTRELRERLDRIEAGLDW